MIGFERIELARLVDLLEFRGIRATEVQLEAKTQAVLQTIWQWAHGGEPLPACLPQPWVGPEVADYHGAGPTPLNWAPLEGYDG